MAYRGWWLAVGYVRRAAASLQCKLCTSPCGTKDLILLSLPISLTRQCSSPVENRSMLPALFTTGSTDFYGATPIITWLSAPCDWWKINLRHACCSPLKYPWNIFLNLIFSMQCYFIWHPGILFLYSPFFDAGMHSSSKLSTDFIMFLFTPALGSLMRMLTKSGPDTNLWLMLPDSASLFYVHYPLPWTFCQLSIHLREELVNNLWMNLSLILLHELRTNSLIVTDLFLTWKFSRNT